VRASTSRHNLRSEHPQLVPEILRGLVELGLDEPAGSEIALELGVSVWMRRSGADLESVRSAMIRLRGALVSAGDLDPASEPLPLLGRSDHRDVLTLVSYLGGLVGRAAVSAGCEPGDLVESVIYSLGPETEPLELRPTEARILQLVRP
jgi:hypothetical protein